MRKPELIENLASATELPKKDVELVVNTMLSQITEALAKGDEIQFMGFGTFSSRFKEASTGHNPRTGEKLAIAAKYVPTFKAGTNLREQVNEGRSTKKKKKKK